MGLALGFESDSAQHPINGNQHRNPRRSTPTPAFTPAQYRAPTAGWSWMPVDNFRGEADRLTTRRACWVPREVNCIPITHQGNVHGPHAPGSR